MPRVVEGPGQQQTPRKVRRGLRAPGASQWKQTPRLHPHSWAGFKQLEGRDDVQEAGAARQAGNAASSGAGQLCVRKGETTEALRLAMRGIRETRWEAGFYVLVRVCVCTQSKL